MCPAFATYCSILSSILRLSASPSRILHSIPSATHRNCESAYLATTLVALSLHRSFKGSLGLSTSESYDWFSPCLDLSRRCLQTGSQRELCQFGFRLRSSILIQEDCLVRPWREERPFSQRPSASSSLVSQSELALTECHYPLEQFRQTTDAHDNVVELFVGHHYFQSPTAMKPAHATG